MENIEMVEPLRVSLFSRLPKWLRVTLFILSVVTVVFWATKLFYKVWGAIGTFLHFLTEKRNWWTYTFCIVLIIVGSLIVAQFFLELNPFGKAWNGVTEYVNNFIETLKMKLL